METKQLFLSDVLKRACRAWKENFWYLCIVQFVYHFLLSAVFVICGIITSGILLSIGFHNMIGRIIQEYAHIQADSALEQSQKVAQLVGVAVHIIGHSIWIIMGAASVFLFVFFIFWFGFYLGFQKILLDMYDGKKAPLSLLFTNFEKLPAYFVAWLGYFLMASSMILFWLVFVVSMARVLASDTVSSIFIFVVASSFLFFLLLCFIVTVKFCFYYLFILDNGVGPIKSLKNSYHMTKGHVIQLSCWFLGYGLISGGIGGFISQYSSIVVIFGFTLVSWFVNFCYIVIYRQLLQERLEVAVGEAEYKQ